MKIETRVKSELIKLSHNKYNCCFTLVDRKIIGKTADQLTFNNLAYTKISSQQLTKTSAKIIGEMFIKISELLSEETKKMTIVEKICVMIIIILVLLFSVAIMLAR